MKIIYCLNSFFPKHSGGTEVYTLSLIREMKKLGHEGIVVIPDITSNIYNEYEIYGVRVISYPENTKFDKKLAWGKHMPEGINFFRDILLKEKPNIVHFQEFSYSVGITLHHFRLAKELGCSVLMTIHIAGYSCFTGELMYMGKTPCSGIIDEYACSKCVMHFKGLRGKKLSILSRFSIFLYKIGINLSKWNNKIGTALGFPFLINSTKQNLIELSQICGKIVVVSEWYHNVLIKNGIQKNRIAIIKQGLALNKSNIIKKKLNTEINPLKIIFLGRVTQIKGIDLLIDVILQFPNESIQLDIYGHTEGTDFEYACKEKSKNHENINWCGLMPPDDVLNKLSEYHLLCLPSVCSEMASLVIQEAFASGIPVLASNTPGNAEYINNGVNGWLFNFADASDLKEKINLLVNNPNLLFKASERIEKVKEFNSIAIEYESIYHSIKFN